jgi:RNA polymerase sigma-70 factor, ECF subfamily
MQRPPTDNLPETDRDGSSSDGWPQSADEFGRLLDAYLDRLVRYAFCRLGSVQDAEDVVQDVLVRVFRDRSRERQISTVGPYLYRCVANGCIDFRRKRSREDGLDDKSDVESLPGEPRSPTAGAEAIEELRRVDRLLGRLPEAQAEVVRLRVFDELTLAEIGEVVGCSVNTVCSRLRYGFRKLREFVAQQEECP